MDVEERAEQERAKLYVAKAKELWHDEGEIEIDDGAPISTGDPNEGSYVQAWVWVSAREVYGECPNCDFAAKTPEHKCQKQ